jgi:hypothetical protein
VANLTGVWAKFNHAKSHMHVLDWLWGEYLNSRPYGVRIEFDAEAEVNRFRWIVRSQLPLHLSLVNGDVWYNLRASLDYLAWQLVLANGNEPTYNTSFPCVKKRQDWAGAVGRKLTGIDPRWIAEIEKLQPYHRGNNFSEHPLFLLDRLNNIYKHRLVPAVIVTPPEVGVMLPLLADGARIEPISKPRVEAGAEWLRVWTDQRIDVSEVEVNPGSVFRISWDDGLGIEWDMEPVIDWVEQTIAFFGPAFWS